STTFLLILLLGTCAALFVIACGSGEPAAPRRQSLLRSQARCALLPAATPRLSVWLGVSCFLGACAVCSMQRIRVGGACGPPPPVAAPLASSLRAPSRGDPPLKNIVPGTPMLSARFNDQRLAS